MRHGVHAHAHQILVLGEDRRRAIAELGPQISGGFRELASDGLAHIGASPRLARSEYQGSPHCGAAAMLLAVTPAAPSLGIDAAVSLTSDCIDSVMLDHPNGR